MSCQPCFCDPCSPGCCELEAGPTRTDAGGARPSSGSDGEPGSRVPSDRAAAGAACSCAPSVESASRAPAGCCC